MSDSEPTAPPGGSQKPGDPTAAPAPVGSIPLAALDGHAEPTDDTPTIISRTGPRPGQEEVAGALRGRRLAHFELIEPIGVGGMAAVIRARDTQLDRLVALKILPPDMAHDPENVRRFHQEARSAARLDHENIARVFFCGEDQRLHFIAFEFVEGDNLRTILERRGRLPVAEALHYILQIAAGLAHAAHRGVVHRDIKPSNIIITPTGRAKLVDMGLARSLERQDKDLTQSGMTLGTFDYISPEQALEPREADARSDIYSLGCTLYHVLTGRPPVPEGTAMKKLHHHQYVKPRDPRELVPGLSDEAAVILDRMMAKRPQDRYQSPEQLVHHLLLAARKLGSAAPHVPEGVLSVEAALPPPPGGRPLVLAGMAAALVVALIVLLEVFNRTPAAGPPLPPPLPDPVAEAKPNHSDPVSPPSAPVKDKPPAPKDNGMADPPPVAATAVYDDSTNPLPLREWLKTVPDAPKDILLSGDVDLTKEGVGLIVSGPQVTIRAKTAGRRPTIKFAYNGLFQGDDASWAALGIVSPDVTVRGLRVVVDGTAANVNLVGLRLQGPRDAAPVFTVDNCELIQTQAQPGPHKKRLASLEAVADGAPADLKLTACRFLSFQKRENDTTLLNEQFGGDDAVVRDGAVRITATDCAFGPHGTDFRLQGGDLGAPLALDHCSVLASGPSAVFDVRDNAAVALKLHACLFSCPDDAVEASDGGAALIRQATPDDRVVCEDSDSRYAGFGAYWVVAGDASRGAGWDAFSARVPAARAPLPAGVSPWKNDDPLAPFQKYNFADAQAETHFVPAFQVMETRPELRVAAAGGKASVPVGVQTLGGVNYAALLAEADRQAAELVMRKRRIVEPGQSDSANRIYGTLEEALSASAPGDEILIRFDGLLPVQPLRLTQTNLQDVTIRPEAGRRPVLLLKPSRDHDAEPALFRVYDGKLTLDGLEFLVQPDDKNFVRQSLVDLAGQGQCVFKNCLITLDIRYAPDTRLAAALLSDPGKAMMPSTRPADQPAQLSFDSCFVRGDGDLTACQTSRPLDLKAANTLAALKGSLLNVEVAPDAAPAPAGQMSMALDRVTTYLTGNLIRLRPGKDSRSLEAVRCAPAHCLFVAAARDPLATLIHLENSDADDKAVQKLLAWAPGDAPTVYGNYDTMLDESSGDVMPQMHAVDADKWEASWDNNAGRLVKRFGFGGPTPPPDPGLFGTAAPLQFKPPAAGDCGADAARLQTLFRAGADGERGASAP